MQLFGVDLYLWAIPAAWLTAFIPLAVRNTMIPKLAGHFNNIHPRTQIQEFEAAKKISSADARFLERCSAAHNNGLENLPIFAVCLLFAMQRGVLPAATLNYLSAAYLVVRLVYNGLYIGGTTRPIASVRSCAWLAGIATCFAFVFKSI